MLYFIIGDTMAKEKEKKEEKVTKPKKEEKEKKVNKRAEKKKEKLENAKALSELSTAQKKIKITRENNVENVLDSVDTPDNSSKLVFENDEFNEKPKEEEEIEYESITVDKKDKKKLIITYIVSFLIYIVLAVTIYLLVTTAIIPAIKEGKIEREQEQIEKQRIKKEQTEEKQRIKKEKEAEKKRQKELEKEKREKEINRQKAAQDIIDQHDKVSESANKNGDTDEAADDEDESLPDNVENENNDNRNVSENGDIDTPVEGTLIE